MNFGTIKLLVKRNLGNRTDIDAYITEWINSTYMDLVTTGKFPEAAHFAPIPVPALDGTTIITTNIEEPNYPVPADFLFPVSMRDLTNNIPLRARDIRWYERKRSTQSGKSYNYIIYGSSLILDPTPNTVNTLVLRYRQKLALPVLVQDTDIPVVGEEWHEGLVLGATYRGTSSLGYPDAAKWQLDLKNFIVGHSEQATEEEEDVDIGFNFTF
jgi:hypothetical protein